MAEGGEPGEDEERDVCSNRAVQRVDGQMFVGARLCALRFRMFVAADLTKEQLLSSPHRRHQ